MIGKEVFGGTGKNFLNPALVGRAFLYFSYPASMSGDAVWVALDGYSGATPLAVAAASGVAGVIGAGYDWWDAFLGVVPGSLGETSALACLLGGAFLVYTRIASWRIIAGVSLGMTATVLALNWAGSDTNPLFSMPWYWHLVLGGFCFGMVFMATEPVSAAHTDAGAMAVRAVDRIHGGDDPGAQPGFSRGDDAGDPVCQHLCASNRLHGDKGKHTQAGQTVCRRGTSAFRAMKNESVKKTLIVTVLLCLVCSVVVSTAAVGLREKQAFNRELDMRVNILKVAGLYRPDRSVEESFKHIEKRVISLNDGKFADMDPASFTMRSAIRDPRLSVPLPPAEDVALIKRRPYHASVYLVRNGDKLGRIVLPISGYGLWSTLYGFLALEADGDTVYGLRFYEHRETPGLGGEVDNPKWRNLWHGKLLYGGREDPRLEVIKGKVAPDDPDAAYKVDGLSGATLTGRGVTNMIRFWMGPLGYRPFLSRLEEYGLR